MRRGGSNEEGRGSREERRVSPGRGRKSLRPALSTHRKMDTLLLWDSQNHLGRSSPPALDQMLRLPSWDIRFPGRTVPECLPLAARSPGQGSAGPGSCCIWRPPSPLQGPLCKGEGPLPLQAPLRVAGALRLERSPGCPCLGLNLSQRESSRTSEPHAPPRAGVRVPGGDEGEATRAAEELLLQSSRVFPSQRSWRQKGPPRSSWTGRESLSKGSLT